MIKYYKVRSAAVFLIFCAGYCVIVANLYILQICKNDFFTQLGNQQYHITTKTMPQRASIYDRNGQYLAINQESYAAFLTPHDLNSVEKVEQFLKKHFPKALHRLHEHAQSHFLYVKRRLTPEQKELIEKEAPADIKLLKEPSRFYPFSAAAQLVGLTDSDTKGLFGVELICNKELAGEPTTVSLQKDARSGHFYFAKETKVEGNEGADIHVTLDADIQHLVMEELKTSVESLHAQEGAALVMDPTNGQIIAMASYPDFDPNSRHHLDLETTKNKLLTESYELGSVMKIVVTLALLEEQLVNPDEEVDCENTSRGTVNGVTFSTWRAHGILPFSEIIQRSNNIGIAKVAARLGPLLYDHYIKMGFGSKTALNWPGEQAGFVNPPERWTRPSLVSLSFGYESRATLMQLAQLFTMIANHGVFVTPTLFLQEEAQKEQRYSSRAVDQVRTILEKTVTHGTAHKAKLEGYSVMGKTGTAIKVIDGRYDPAHNIYTFAGIIEKDNYKRVIVTFINDAHVARNVYASTIAVPLFERIAHDVLLHDTIITKEISENPKNDDIHSS